jgi:methylmalonyl-CoA carboxyltransferase 12S subunit
VTTNQAVPTEPVAAPAPGESLVSAEVVAELLRRVAAMETELEELRAKVDANVPEDVVLAICAAVAAFLGKRATVRQIHLVGDTTWAREGRAYVQSVHSASRRR